MTLGDGLIGAKESDKGEAVVAVQRLIGYAGFTDEPGPAGLNGN
ncbi:hypothetical protein GCM10027294_46390 [Marinactinospora endophytica]